MKIEKATLQQGFNSRLNFFNSATQVSKREIATWLIASSLSILALFSSLFLIQRNTVSQLALFNNKHNVLAEENEDLKDKMHAFDHFEGSQKELVHRFRHLKSLQKHPHNLRRLLKTVSVSIQKTTWVQRVVLVKPPAETGTMIALEQNKQLAQEPETFHIEGASLDEQEVVAFTQYLTRVQFVSKVSIDSISREQHQHQRINFALSGAVKKCTCPCTLPFKQKFKKDLSNA